MKKVKSYDKFIKNKFNPKPSTKTYGWMPNPKTIVTKVKENIFSTLDKYKHDEKTKTLIDFIKNVGTDDLKLNQTVDKKTFTFKFNDDTITISKSLIDENIELLINDKIKDTHPNLKKELFYNIEQIYRTKTTRSNS